jgi:hypothetical protein
VSPHPVGPDRRAAYRSGQSLSEFLGTATANESLWAALSARARVPEEMSARAGNMPGTWYLLVLLEDWCGDAVNTIPVMARLAGDTSNIHMRVLRRDDHPALMNEHLTAGKRAIPVVMVLDNAFREVGWWGPRPRELQDWAMSVGAALAKSDRYRGLRRWYAVDRGRQVLEEILQIICEAAGVSKCRAA